MGQNALTSVEDMRVVRWIRTFFQYLAVKVEFALARRLYVRSKHKEFKTTMNSLACIYDANCQGCRSFCERCYARLKGDDRIAFASAVVSYLRMEGAAAIQYFADREREYIRLYFGAF